MEPATGRPPSKPPLQGIAGWLLALAILNGFFILITAIGFLNSCWRFVVGWPGVPIPDGQTAAALLAMVQAIELGVAAFTLFLLVERRALFVKIFTLQLVLFALEPVAQLPSISIAAEALHLEFSPFGKIGRTIVHALIAFALWQYVRTSVRVRNTLVK